LCGYSQRPGVHFDKTFTATAKATSIRIFFALVALFDLELKGIDVVKAFTQAMLSDADLYCEQMEGFEEYDKTTREKLVCKLKMALEGGRQSGHLWQQANTDFLKSYGFTQFWGEPCIFTLKRDGSFLLVIVWIDDLAIAYANKDENLFDQFATAYGKRFKSKISACVDKFIGLKITRNRDARTLTLSQELYIEKMADRFLPNKTLRKSTTTPAWFTDKAQRVSTFSKLGIATTESDSAIKQGKPYLELVASILYAATMTRPDISYHTSMLCRFMHNPSIDCYSRAEELLNYLYSTKGMTLVLGGKTISVPHFNTLRDAGAKEINHNEFAQRITGNYGLHFYSDASWKTDHTYIAHLGMFANGPVDWSSRLLKVAASSCQAETAAGCVAAKRNTFLRNLLGHLLDAIGTKLSGGATVLLMDNSAAVEQADHAGASKKTEHYKRWEYYLRECQLDGSIKAHFIRTCDQVADCLTKVLDKTTFLKLRQHLIR
ncbi:MAG: hypothetical protein HC767_02915, partial [Akkermansiaceae bacterium]|nr:hypothetical protein [Akkermansiaceae bacterium]